MPSNHPTNHPSNQIVRLVGSTKKLDRYVEEWILYHKLIGVDEVVLFTAKVEANIQSVLERYSEFFKLYLLPELSELQLAQKADSYFGPLDNSSGWILRLNPREFLKLGNDQTLPQLLSKKPEMAQVKLAFYKFGYNGCLKDPSTLLGSLTRRSAKPFKFASPLKSSGGVNSVNATAQTSTVHLDPEMLVQVYGVASFEEWLSTQDLAMTGYSEFAELIERDFQAVSPTLQIFCESIASSDNKILDESLKDFYPLVKTLRNRFFGIQKIQLSSDVSMNPRSRLLGAALMPFGYDFSHLTNDDRVLRPANECAQLLHLQNLDRHLNFDQASKFLLSSARLLMGLLKLRIKNIPIVWTIQSLESAPKRFAIAYQAIEFLVAHLASRIVVPSQWRRDQLRKSNLLRYKKVRVAAPGVSDLPAISNERDYKKLLNQENKTVYLYFGSIETHKGVAPLLDVFNRIARPKDQLIICGVPETEELKRALRWRLTDQSVFFLRNIEDENLAKLFALADFCIFPFEKVTNVSSILMALSFGKAVIAPIRAGISEFLPDHIAILYDPKDPLGLDTALRQSRHRSSQKMGERAKIWAEQFQWTNTAKVYAQVFKELLEGKKAASVKIPLQLPKKSEATHVELAGPKPTAVNPSTQINSFIMDPEKAKKLDLRQWRSVFDGIVYNPGVLDAGGGNFHVLLRGERGRNFPFDYDGAKFHQSSTILYALVDSKHQVKDCFRIEMVEAPGCGPDTVWRFEDFRLFRWRDEIYVNFVRFSYPVNMNHFMTTTSPNCRMMVGKLDLERRIIHTIREPKVDLTLQSQEKNWVFFEKSDDLYLIQSSRPFSLLKLHDPLNFSFKLIRHSEMSLPQLDNLHSSCNPIDYSRTHLLYFAHHKNKSEMDYTIFPILLNKLTLKVEYQTRRPLFYGGNLSHKTSGYDKVLFVSSITVDDLKVTLWAGHRDLETRIFEIPRSQLDSEWQGCALRDLRTLHDERDSHSIKSAETESKVESISEGILH